MPGGAARRLGALVRRFQPDPKRWEHLFSATRRPLVLGHRGFGKGRSPAENTRGAFDAALACGADGFELDVILSRDGVPVVAHGPTAELAGKPDLLLEQMTLAELRGLNLAQTVGGGPERILTLGELLEEYGGRTLINVELKPWRIVNGSVERAVAPVLAPYVKRGDRILCSSFNPFSLRRLRALLPEVCLGMLWRDDLHWFAHNRSLFWFVHPDFLHPFEGRIDGRLLAYAKERGYRLHAWTINDEVRFRELADRGVQLFVTDEVQAAVRWRDSWRAEAGIPADGDARGARQ